ncbi:MAG: hypothetical protein QOH09_2912, partial [Pseudonocardiales bacterium]|nr:hypothetical protein [Pseudonocardiales bacterium]
MGSGFDPQAAHKLARQRAEQANMRSTRVILHVLLGRARQ